MYVGCVAVAYASASKMPVVRSVGPRDARPALRWTSSFLDALPKSQGKREIGLLVRSMEETKTKIKLSREIELDLQCCSYTLILKAGYSPISSSG